MFKTIKNVALKGASQLTKNKIGKSAITIWTPKWDIFRARVRNEWEQQQQKAQICLREFSEGTESFTKSM